MNNAKTIGLTVALFSLFQGTAMAAQRPVVVELFTSQGCSSCPPADELLATMADDPAILALSFHVHYWDRLGWKDPFSSVENTQRQKMYDSLLGQSTIFTPQMIIDGHLSAVGSYTDRVKAAITDAQKDTMTLPVSIKPDKMRMNLDIHIAANGDPKLPPNAAIWQVFFTRWTLTSVEAGENNGEMIKNAHNVTRAVKLGTWQHAAGDYHLALSDMPEDGVAIIVQADEQGRVIGAASYLKPQ